MTFEILPLGVRGSYPGSATRPSSFGTDTTCFFVMIEGQGLILDAGSGLTRLDSSIMKTVERDSLALLFTHYHLDHLLGFPFFRHGSKDPLPVYGPVLDGRGPEQALRYLMAPPLTPIGLDVLEPFNFHAFTPGTCFSIGGVGVQTLMVNHPGGALAYRLDGGTGEQARSLAFIPDVEHSTHVDADPDLIAFVSGCDAVIYDCMYSPEAWPKHHGWGHSHWQAGQSLCRAANVPLLIPTHYDPRLTDTELEAQNQESAQGKADVSTEFAREGVVIRL